MVHCGGLLFIEVNITPIWAGKQIYRLEPRASDGGGIVRRALKEVNRNTTV